MADARITLGAVDNTRAAFDSVKGNLQGLHTSATAVLGALGALGSVAVFASMIKGSIDAAAGLNDLSIQTGATVEALSALGSVGKLSDVSLEQIGGAMNKLAKNMAGASEESKGTGKALEALGINFNDFKKLSPEAQMQAVAKAMDKSADGSGKAAVAMALYGKEGAKMLPFFKDLAQVGDLQAKVTTEQAAQADNFADNLTKLQVSGSAWTKELAMGMVPALDLGTQAFTDTMNGVGGLREEMRRLAADGSIALWTENTIKFVTHVMDVFQGLAGVAEIVRLAFKNVFLDIKTVGSTAALAIAAFKNADFSDAANIVGRGLDDIAGRSQKFKSDMDELWNPKLVGAQIRDNMVYNMARAMADAGEVAEKTKPKVDYTNVLDKNAKAAKEGAKATKEAEKAYNDLVKAAQALANVRNAEADSIAAWFQAEEKARLATVKAANDSVQAAQDEYDNFGKTKSQIAEVTLARLNDKLQGVNAGTEIAASIELEIEAQQRLIGILQKGEVRDAGVEAAKDAAAEWKKTTDDIGRGLTDSLFRAFESGKGFFSTLWSGIKNLFKTTALKLIINPVAGAVTGALGLGGTANAATGGGGGGDLMGVASNAKSLMGMNTGWFTDFGATSVGSLSSTGAQLFSKGFETAGSAMMDTANSLAQYSDVISGAGDVLGYAGALYSLSQGNYGAAAGAAIGTYFGGPIGAAIGSKIGGLLDKEDKPSWSTGDSQMSFDAAGRATSRLDLSTVSFKAAASAQADAFVQGMQASYAQLAASIGATTVGSAFAFGGNSGKGGESPNFALASTAGGVSFAQGETKITDGVIELAASRAVFAALQGSELPKYLKGAFDGMTAGALTQEQISGILAAAQALKGFHDQLQALPFESLKDLSFSAYSGLIAFSGGLESLRTNLGSYLDNFYSEEEKRTLTIKSINASTAGSGLDAATASRETFRKLVEAQDLTTESGQKNYAALISVNAAFAALNPAIESVAAAVDTVAAGISDTLRSLQSDATNLQIEIMRKTGNAGGADYAQRTLDTTGYSAAEVALYDYNAGLRAQIAALDAATAAAQAAAQAQAAIASERAGLQSQYDKLTLDSTALLAQQRDGLDASNRALFDSINAVNAKTAADAAAAQATQAIASERLGLQTQFDQMTMTSAQLLAQQRDGLDASNRALFDSINAVNAKTAADAAAAQATQAIASERLGLQTQLDQLTMTSAQLLGKQRDALDASNQALFDQVQGATAAAAALQEAAAKTAAIASERLGLQTQLDQLTMTSAELLAKQRDALYGSNQALFDQIQALTAAKAASEAATALVASDAAAYASGVARQQAATKALIASLDDFTQSLLGTAITLASPEKAYLDAKTAFTADALAAAKGDKAAMAAIPELGQALLDASKEFFGSAGGYFKDLASVQTAVGNTKSGIAARQDRQDAYFGLQPGEGFDKPDYAAAKAAMAAIQAAQARDTLYVGLGTVFTPVRGERVQAAQPARQGGSDNREVVAELKALVRVQSQANQVLVARLEVLGEQLDDIKKNGALADQAR